MRVLALTKGNEGVASSRVRVWQLFERLEEQQVSSVILHSFSYPWWSLSRKRFVALGSVLRELKRNPDMVFVHKSLFPWDVVMLVVTWCRMKRIPFVYDCDDGEWLHSPRKTNVLMRRAAVVFAGSQNIMERAEKYNSRVEHIPSVVDHKLYEGVMHDSHPPVIVWVGHGPAHLRSGNFEVLRASLRALARRGTVFQFVLVGGNDDKAIHEYWGSESYNVRIIDKADWKNAKVDGEIFRELQPVIGVMPLKDSPFVRAKCAYKAIEYMAAGIPVIASPVGEAVPLIETSRAGILANTEDEWVDAIEKLLGDEESRRIMGERGIEQVKNRYSYEAIVPAVRGIFESLRKS